MRRLLYEVAFLFNLNYHPTMKTLLFSLSLLISLSAIAGNSFTIVRGKQDTTTNKSHNIVCVTTPGNSAYINGNKIHVYKTGAFGDNIKLNKGDNKITIRTKGKNGSTSQTLNIFLKDTPKKINIPTTPSRIIFDSPKYFTTINGAYLQYGDGGDRLGGSKIEYINGDIIVKAIEQKGELYKIQLSKNRFAYINKEYLNETNDTTSQINTGSWSISNAGKSDRISISLPKRIPYRSWTQLDPTTICVELFGATNNSNWITQRGNLGMIEYVDYRQDDSDVFKVIIKLKHKHSWGYSINYINNNLVIDVKHTPSLNLKDLTIGLDAGHGGEYPGAKSATGLLEKEINLDMILRIKALLEAKGAKVILSREKDINISMSDRKKIFTDNNIDLMISLHNNSGGSPFTTMGTSTYYKHINNRELASCMLNRLLELGLKNFGLTGNFNFSLNAPTEYPNVLLEVLFMSSLPEEEMLANPDFRQQVATKAVLGLEDYINSVKNNL